MKAIWIWKMVEYQQTERYEWKFGEKKKRREREANKRGDVV